MTAALRPARRRPMRGYLLALSASVIVSAAACGPDQAASSNAAGGDSSIELRDETGPHVDAPDRAMAMTVDAVEIVSDDILVRLRVENHAASYLDMGVQDTIYGSVLVMRDDRGHVYESYAVEPAGIPGRRVADLSVRLRGPLDPDAESFTLELATQRGPLASPPGALPLDEGARWRVDDAMAEPPRLPELIHFWLETDPLPDDT